MGIKPWSLNNDFTVSARANVLCYENLLQQACNIAVSSIEWEDLSPEIDELFMERILMERGSILVFNDKYRGMIALPFIGECFDLYNRPKYRRPYSPEMEDFTYNRVLDETNSVIIYNNAYRQPTYPWIEEKIIDIYNLLTTYRVNCNGLKTPILLEGDEKQKLSLLNAYKDYSGNLPVMHFYQGLAEQIKVLDLKVPFNLDKLHDEISKTWNDLMSYLGITAMTETKKERLVTSEAQSMMAGAFAHRQSRMRPREKAAKEINKMFGLNWTPKFNNFDGPEPDRKEGVEDGSSNNQDQDNMRERD